RRDPRRSCRCAEGDRGRRALPRLGRLRHGLRPRPDGRRRPGGDLMAGRVEGKVALISGGARGQGAEHARLLAEEGAAVVFGDILDDAGEEVAASLTAEGLRVRYLHLDVTSASDWSAAAALCESEFG